MLILWLYQHFKHWREDREAEKREQGAEASDKDGNQNCMQRFKRACRRIR